MNTKHLFGHTRSWQKIFVGTKIFSPFTPASRGSIDRRWSPLGGGGPATSRVILARYGADIEGTLGQGTFTQYRGSNWHKYIKQKAYHCSTWLFCQFQHSMLLGTVRSARGWQKCVPARAVSAWRRWTLAVVSGQWSVGSSLKVRFPPQQLSIARCQARPHPNHWQSSFPIQSLLFCSMYISWTRFRCSSDCIVC